MMYLVNSLTMIKNMILQTIPVICSLAVASIACTSGAASAPDGASDLDGPTPIFDSVMTAALGDSICDIIANAKTVQAEILEHKDSTIQASAIMELTAEQKAILGFLMCDRVNVASNKPIFGKFLPNISFRFIYKRKEIYVVLDFGLRKWRFNDVNGQLLKEFDFQSPELLRFAHTLFPDDEFINLMLNPQ